MLKFIEVYPMASVVWNIITRNIHADEQTRKEIRQKLAGLEKHLEAFPPNKLHQHEYRRR